MPVQQTQYEELLARYSTHLSAIELLKQHRPYLEMVPSIRRSQESLITIPLPLVQVSCSVNSCQSSRSAAHELISLPCDIALLMCDPEWKVKTGIEIFVFIHRPQEDFSQLLNRWRQTEVLLSKGYEWQMPPRHKHIFGEGAEKLCPLFVLFEGSQARIKQGLQGAYLPTVIQTVEVAFDLIPKVDQDNLGARLE